MRSSRARKAVPFEGVLAGRRHLGPLERAVVQWAGDRDVLVATKDGWIVALTPADTDVPGPRTGPKTLGDLMLAVLERSRHGRPWRVTVGRPYPGSYGIARSYEEAREGLRSLNNDLVSLEKLLERPTSDATTARAREVMDAAFRTAHSLKGMGAAMGYVGFAELAHRLEDLADLARQGKAIGAEGFDLLLESSDKLEEMVETEVQQPALVATSLAILAAMREQGLAPDVVVGHSVGEFAALAAAGSR